MLTLRRAAGVQRRELLLLAGLLVLGLALRVAAVLATHGAPLAGDEPEYAAEGRLFAAGHAFWGVVPTGHPHPSIWKAPGYGTFVGIVYSAVGDGRIGLGIVQAVIGLATIVLAWALGRRLFGRGVGIAAAAVTAVYPLVWQYEPLLYPEALAVPLTLLILYLTLGRAPTARRATGVGALVGLALLVRPTSFILLAAVAAAWLVAAGLRRGAAMTVLSIAVAVLVVAPWTIRNYVVTHAFVPISVQDAAIQGTFNPTSANDSVYPYAWRAITPVTRALITRRRPLTELELRSRYDQLASDYIKAHPLSVPQAFFWNGLSRFWDVRRPGHALAEVPFEGRNRKITLVGLVMYYVLLPLALVGLYRVRRRRELLLPVLALALAASIVFTIDAGTRYRAPLEPLIVVLACSTFAAPLNRLAERGRSAASRDAPPAAVTA